MRLDNTSKRCTRKKYTPNKLTFSRWIIWGVFLVQLAGCRGCNTTPTETDEKKKKEDKQRLTLEEMRVIPSSKDISLNFVKPGHWIQTRQDAKANQADESMALNMSVVDQELQPVPYRATEIIQFSRDVALAKGQLKGSGLLSYVPELPVVRETGVLTRPAFRVSYGQRGTGIPIAEQAYPITPLKPEQYLLLVASREPARHAHWSGLSCVIWPSEAKMEDEKIATNRVVEISEENLPSWLPDNLLTWTTISHLVLYDANLSGLSEQQQTALVDWLHFGGQIVLSGPDCLSAVSNSILEPYLPLTKIKTQEISPESIANLNKGWMVKDGRGLKTPIALPATRVLSVIAGDLTPGAQWVTDAEQFVATRPVGRGRITMTSFSLSEDVFVRWPSFSSFVNGAIFRKPPRAWATGELGDLRYVGKYRGMERSPGLSSSCRFLARDLGMSALEKQSTTPEGSAVLDSFNPESERDRNVAEERLGHRSPAGWNDDSGISKSSQSTLQAASGITVPRVEKIIQLLAGYLIILVPVNWLVFRIIRRVELAWVAAPFIAIIGAVVVARSVQLDIGFSRSENRITCLELHEKFPRGHLASYVSLYTSLSSLYDLVYPTGAGVILPYVGVDGSPGRSGLRQVRYRYADEKGDGLVRVPVISNTTSFFHGEEMVDVKGSFVGDFVDGTERTMKVDNNSRCTLRGGAIIGRDAQGTYLRGWIGDLDTNLSKSVELKEFAKDTLWVPQWDESPVTRAQTPILLDDGSTRIAADSAGELTVGIIFDRILRSSEIAPKEFVLIGWTDQDFATLSVTPQANQIRQKTVVLVHLEYPQLPDTQPDESLPSLTTDTALSESDKQ